MGLEEFGGFSKVEIFPEEKNTYVYLQPLGLSG